MVRSRWRLILPHLSMSDGIKSVGKGVKLRHRVSDGADGCHGDRAQLVDVFNIMHRVMALTAAVMEWHQKIIVFLCKVWFSADKIKIVRP